MACLVPQFKCPSADVHFRHNHPHHLKARDHACFRSQCVLTQMTSVIDIERLQITSPAYPTSSANASPLTYLGAIGPPVKRDSEVIFAEETLLASEEALIAAASAEAVALARVAAEVAKDAAQMTGNDPSVKSVKPEGSPCDADILKLESVWLSNMEHATTVDRSLMSAEEYDGDTQYMLGNNTGISNITDDKDITARSGRQNERRARRARAVDKATATVFPIKSGSSSRKKRSVAQEIDYSDPLRYLRGTTNASKLLTVAEELELSEGIQDLLKLDRLQEELTERNGGKPTFSQWASAAGVDQKTLRKRLNYGARCKDKMVKHNVRLVISIAKNYQGAGMNIQDLVQEGCRGLIKGAEKFDASKGFKFSTYAHWWIKQAIRKSLSNQSRTIRLPFHMVDATYRVKEARKLLFSENRRYPTDEELAKVTGLSMRRLTAVMLTPKPPRSLDQKIGINMNLKPSEMISHPDALSADHILIRQFMKQDLNKVLDTLNQREKQVVRMRFGLDDGRMKTLQEIGESMGVSRERIRQIESCAFRKLKSKRRSKNLQQYILP